MTKEEFVRNWEPQLLLWIAEAWAVRGDPPSALGLTIDRQHRRAKQMLGSMYDQLIPPAPANGAPAQPQRSATR